MKSEITSKILKQELVPWRELKWLQSSKLKDLGTKGIEKLKNSLKENNFVQPFNVWQDGKGVVWILDGHHREKALKQLEAEGYEIPELLPANFVECADRKDAGKMVLVYSSIYAKITNDGLGEFLDDFELDLSNLVNEIDLPGIDLADALLEAPELEDGDREPYQQMAFLLSDEQVERIQSVLDCVPMQPDNYGNENRNGNKLYSLAVEWEKLKI